MEIRHGSSRHIVRLVDVIFIILFGYLALANFDRRAETDMPTKQQENATEQNSEDDQEVLQLQLTVYQATDEYRYSLEAPDKQGSYRHLFGDRALNLEPDRKSSQRFLYFNDLAVLDEVFRFRSVQQQDNDFRLHIVGTSSAFMRDIFRPVDICAEYGILAMNATDGSEDTPPNRLTFKYQSRSDRNDRP